MNGSRPLFFQAPRSLFSVRSYPIDGWVGAIVAFLACLLLYDRIPALGSYPDSATLPFDAWLDQALHALAPLKPAFRCLSGAIEWPFLVLQRSLAAFPYPVIILGAAMLVYETAGRNAALVTFLALSYCVITGYWHQSVTTLALVLTAIPYAAISGFSLGVLGARYPRAKLLLEPTLDLMQTVPTFAYLIPLFFFLGFGPAVGLTASVIFALPPMVRNTMLALERIPPEILEVAVMTGCTPWQRFAWVEFPTARRQLLIGINQTTLSVFSMLIIAALVGGYNDMGWEVLTMIRQASFGGSLRAGLLIVLMAVALDQITCGFILAASPAHQTNDRVRIAIMTRRLISITAILVLAIALPRDLEWPSVYALDFKFLDQALIKFVSGHADDIDAFKSVLLLYLLQPIKIGLRDVVSESTWGFDLTAPMIWTYWAAACALTMIETLRVSSRRGFAVIVVAAILYMGFLGLPWIAIATAVIAAAAGAGGARLAVFVAAALTFILLSGDWESAAVSVYLCGVAVAACFVIGFPIGVLAARSDVAWNVVRPICDFLQTIPQFIYLIPVLMFFGVGDFAGLVAIIGYSVVPIIRYTQEGLSQVPSEQTEAAKACGCTPMQEFLQVQLPHAMPVILLGINQAILFALGMLVISSLVGTDGLGQQIYLALSKNQPGAGLVAGFCMALIGIVSDRILRAAIRNKSGLS